MPVTVRGAYAGKVSPAGWTSIAWPSGTAVGDLAWVHCGGSMSPLGPDSFGWIPVGHKSWWKILSASDLSANATARRGLPGSLPISRQMSVQRPQRKREQLSK